MECFVNPFGTIYDPLSMTRLLRMAIKDEQPGDEYLVQSDGVWKNLLLHSSFSGLSQDELKLKIRAVLSQVKKQLENAISAIEENPGIVLYTISNSEIADTLGSSRGTILSRLSRLKQRLRNRERRKEG